MGGKQQQTFLSSVITELNQRRIFRTVGTYAVAAFIGLQLLDATGEALLLPQWVQTAVAVAVILGFPLVFVFAWVFQVSSSGIQRHGPGTLSPGRTMILFTFMMLLTIGLGAGLYRHYADVFTTVPGVGQLVDGQVSTAAAPSSAPENSIAVLPFDDLSAEQDQAFLSDGVAEEILNLLAQVDGLQVAARTSSFAFRGQSKDIKEIGRLLNVRKVLEGSIRSDGAQVRLTAQLIDVETGFHDWSKTYDRELTDLFDLQDDVAQSIAGSLLDSFTGLETDRSPFAVTSSLSAYEAYRTGRLHWWRRSEDELLKAVDYFAEAIRHDPEYAPAHAALADSWLLLSSYGNVSREQAIRRAEPAILRALELDPESAEAYSALGLARWQIGQLGSAESALRRAAGLNDDYIPAQLWLAGLLGDLGRLPEERLILEQALAKDPFNELLNINLSGLYFQAGEYQPGIELLQQMLTVKPNSAMLFRTLANWAGAFGNITDAYKWSRQAVNLAPEDPLALTALSQAWLDLDMPDQAEATWQQALDVASQNEAVQVSLFFFYLSQGRVEDMKQLLGSEETVDVLQLQQQGRYNQDQFQRGLIALLEHDAAGAAAYLTRARDATPDLIPDGQTLAMLTMLALAQQQSGDAGAAEASMEEVDRLILRARMAGFELPDLTYVEACVSAMRGNADAAMESLRKAYEQGFRRVWLVNVDFRLDGVREHADFDSWLRLIASDVEAARSELAKLDLVMR